MTKDKGYLIPVLEGLILIVSILLLLVFVNSSATYKLNYNIYPETTHLTLQQGSDYTLNVYYKMNTSETFNFLFNVYSDNGIYTHTKHTIATYRDFTLPMYIKVGNVAPGNYTLVLSTKVLYNGFIQERQTKIVIKVVPKEKYTFHTSNYTNAQPELKLVDISTRNLLISPGQKQTILLKFTNTGSASNFYLKDFINSEDKNKVHVDFSKKSFYLGNNEETNILVDINIDKNYNINYTTIDFYAQEQVTNNTLDLGQVNITLKKQNILLAYNKDTKSLDITNIGTDVVPVNVKTNTRDFSFLLTPNQTYYLQANKDENDVNILLNGKLFKEIPLGTETIDKNSDQNKLIPSVSRGITGLFSFGEGSLSWIIYMLIALVIILAIYKSFFSKNAIFGKTVYAKDLKLDA